MEIQAVRCMSFVNIDLVLECLWTYENFAFLAIFTDICMIILYLLWGTQHFTIYLICIPCKYYRNLKTNLNIYTVALMEN